MDFDKLLKKISPVLRRITRRLSRYSSYCGDDDLFQEASVHLWEEFNAGRLSDKTDSYILQGCYFHLKNYMRKQRPRANLLSLEAIVADNTESMNELLCLKDERSECLRETLSDKLLAEVIMNNGLTGKERRILSFCARGLTTREIGREFGVSHVSIIKAMRKIEVKCRKYID